MSSLIRLYPACYKGDIQAINAGSLDVHINLQYKKWKEAGKMVEDNHAHQTQIYKKIKKIKECYENNGLFRKCWNASGLQFRF